MKAYSDVEEALHELGIPENASPREKLKGACQWHLGHNDWASTFLAWADECGYEIKEKKPEQER